MAETKLVMDASVVIDFLRTGKQAWGADQTLIMSVVTVAELYGGESAQIGGWQRTLLENFWRGVEIVIPTMKNARLAGELKYKYDMSLGDAFVAALALEEELPLATLDQGDFEKIRGLKLYPIRPV